MATKKKSTSVSKKKTASKTESKSASKKSTSAPSKKTSKKAARKTGTKSTTSRASAASGFDAPSHMDEEFAAASSPAYSPSTSPSYGAPQASEDDGRGSLLRLGALVVLGVVLVVLLSIKFLGGKSDEVADTTGKPVVEEPAGMSEPETPAAPGDAVDSQEAVDEAAKPAAPETKPPVASSAEKTYTVKEGDTLWGVAAQEMGNGNQWQKIYDANKLKSRSLSAGQTLVIPAH